MKALVLAAGEGTRLRPLTDDIPKAMVRVGGVPVLERNIVWLASQGVTDLAVNLHHLPDVVRAHFGDGSRFGTCIRWSYEPELLGTAGSLIPLREWLVDGRFLVLYGDNLVNCNLPEFVAVHERSAAEISVALWEREDTSASGVAELEGSRITRFVEKPIPGDTESHWVSAGLLLCEPSVLAAVGDDPPVDFGHDVLPALLEDGRVAGYRMGVGETLEWIDTLADLDRVERTLGQNPSP